MKDSKSPSDSKQSKEPEAEAEGKKKTQFIYPAHAGEGKWGSCIRVVDPVSKDSKFVLELDDNEAAVRYVFAFICVGSVLIFWLFFYFIFCVAVLFVCLS